MTPFIVALAFAEPVEIDRKDSNPTVDSISDVSEDTNVQSDNMELVEPFTLDILSTGHLGMTGTADTTFQRYKFGKGSLPLLYLE